MLRFALAVVLVSAPALAHIALRVPTPRYADQKQGPCGRGSLDRRSANVTTFTAGDTIQVVWDETINHPGHYRISFDTDGTDFYTPTSFTDADGGLNVLVDDIRDAPLPNQRYTMMVRLPDTPCTNCTLQVIQVMTDKAPYGNGDDIYFQCADLVLLPRDAGTATADAGTSDAGVDAGQPMPTDGGVTITPIPDAGESDGGHDHGAPEPTPMGCGCAGVPAPLLLALAVLGLWRRRR